MTKSRDIIVLDNEYWLNDFFYPLILFKASKPYLPLKFSFNKVSTEKLKNYNLGCHALIVIQVTSTVRWWSIFKNRCRMDRIMTILF